MEKRNRLKELREAADLTQEQLAEKVGTKPQTIYKLENGQRKLSPAWIYKLCSALDRRPHELLPAFLDLYTPRQKALLEKLEKLDAAEKEIIEELTKK